MTKLCYTQRGFEKERDRILKSSKETNIKLEMWKQSYFHNRRHVFRQTNNLVFLNSPAWIDFAELLNLPPNSPDAAIFTNNGTASPTPGGSTTPAASETSSPPKNDGGSSAYAHGRQSAGLLLTAVAIFFFAFPTGLKLMPPSFST